MDREKVIESLRDLRRYIEDMEWSDDREDRRAATDYWQAVTDAITLLKEQEAIEPDVDSEGTCTCGNCGENVGWYPAGSKEPVKLGKFCSECGKAVKWE